MKIRSLIVLLTLAVIAGSAMASEAVRLAATGSGSASLADASAHRLALDEMRPLAAMYVPTRQLSAAEMPNCSDCH